MPRIALVSLVLLLAGGVNAKDYIARGDALFDDSDASFRRYEKEVKRVLHRAWESDVIVRVVHLPPFDPEYAVGIIRSRGGYRAFRLEASYFIWGALHDEKEKVPSIHGIYRERPLDDASAQRIVALWRALLASPQNYGKDPTIYGDSSTFHFFVGASRGEHLAGWTSYLLRGSKARELSDIADKLYDYAAQKPRSDAKLQDEIHRVERQFRLEPRSASNHALELTAARCVSTFSMTRLLPPQFSLAPGGRSSACFR